MLPRCFVLIPCFNEEGNLLRLVERLVEVFGTNGWSWQILCVNDGSHDQTGEEIDRAQAKYGNLLRVDHPRNLGFAQAIRTGVETLLQQPNLDGAFIMDADLTHDPASLVLFASALESGADLVIGSRYIERGKMERVPLWRRAMSGLGNSVGHLMGIPVKDATSGYRAFSRKALEIVRSCRENDFSIQLEEVLLCRKAGLRLAEVPITLGVRDVGISKFHYSIRLFWRYFLLLFFLRSRARDRRG